VLDKRAGFIALAPVGHEGAWFADLVLLPAVQYPRKNFCFVPVMEAAPD
jgi:hypothetical protein